MLLSSLWWWLLLKIIMDVYHLCHVHMQKFVQNMCTAQKEQTEPSRIDYSLFSIPQFVLCRMHTAPNFVSVHATALSTFSWTLSNISSTFRVWKKERESRAMIQVSGENLLCTYPLVLSHVLRTHWDRSFSRPSIWFCS